METIEIRHFHLFAGLGGGAQGFNHGEARLGPCAARFRCIGGIDSDPAAITDFTRASGVSGTVLDLFDRAQYTAFHGKEPPADWREATPDDLRRAAHGERPHIIFTSPPCKGFSGLLSETRSRTSKYQALNHLTVRGIWLALEAWRDDPIEFFLLENVPRIANRGRALLDQITQLLRAYGYVVAETTHDCGELGGLAQTRKRFLLVARHPEKVPAFLYEPEKRPLRAIGDVLGKMPMPGDSVAGPMHRLPALQWKTWVRLAFVEAGSDWRSLQKLAVRDGHLADYLLVPEMRNGTLGVNGWNERVGTIQGESLPNNGNFSVADPRFTASRKWHDGQAYGVLDWLRSSGTITGQRSPGQGTFAVADPRMPDSRQRQNGIFRVVQWAAAAGSITGAAHVAGAAMSVADPRRHNPGFGKYIVTPWESQSGCVIGASTTGNGAFAVADPRPAVDPEKRENYLTGGHYGVVPWTNHANVVSGSGSHDNGYNSVADPRMPEPTTRMTAVIRALDNTWHRPFTTLELAALQSLVEPEEHLELAGLSDSAWRERIGNAVPPRAAQAIAGVMGRALLGAWQGETFALSSAPIWVRPVAVAISTHLPRAL